MLFIRINTNERLVINIYQVRSNIPSDARPAQTPETVFQL